MNQRSIEQPNRCCFPPVSREMPTLSCMGHLAPWCLSLFIVSGFPITRAGRGHFWAHYPQRDAYIIHAVATRHAMAPAQRDVAWIVVLKLGERVKVLGKNLVITWWMLYTAWSYQCCVNVQVFLVRKNGKSGKNTSMSDFSCVGLLHSYIAEEVCT